jgi:thiol-disulfide isomerase/thioredoxin
MYFCLNSISMKYFLGAILLILTISCNTTNKGNTLTYFGGQIINPRTNFVLLLKDDKIIDTLSLKNNNKFIASYKSFSEGLYTFKHGNEFQYIYIEPADSVLIRLNTWDFDESLVFNGKGSSKNEFLINLFLQNEKEEKAMYQYFNLTENDFQFKIDSLAIERENIYNDFLQNEENISEGFQKLTNTAIHFPLYRLKEIYPYYYKKAHKLSKFPEISKDFYNFRDNINLNEDNLLSFYPYRNYVINYLYNVSYQIKEKDSTKDNITVNILNAIVENVKLEEFKNTLLKGIVVEDFLKSESTCSINKETLNIFLENCTDEEYVTQVKNLVNDSKFVLNNELLPDFKIENFSNEILNCNDITKNKNTVIYFWSTEYMSLEYLTKRIQYLEKNYPNILFVGINTQPSVNHIPSEHSFTNLENQFKLTKDSAAHQFLTSTYPRTILVNNKGIVTNGFTYLDSKKFSSELTKLEKN